MSTAKKLFKTAALLLNLIDDIIPVVSNHGYTFVSDEWFAHRRKYPQWAVVRRWGLFGSQHKLEANIH